MWTLYRPDGYIMRFYIEGCANLYAKVWGGKLIYDASQPGDTEVIKPHDSMKLAA